MALVVKHAFGKYRRGDQITDAAAVAAALSSNPGHVVKVADAPAPTPAPAVSDSKSS